MSGSNSTTGTMTEAREEAPPPQPKRAATFTSSSQPFDATSALHARIPRRKSSAQSLSSSHSRSPAPGRQSIERRASTFSLSSIDELTTDLINPSFTRQRGEDDEEGEDEVTNWHSTPLLFALLPAVGGVLFKEGAAVVTDLLILGLAAIFLNWSVRLPWDWYYAAQVLVRREEARLEDGEEEGDETGLDESEGRGADPKEDDTRPATESSASDLASGRNPMAAVAEGREQALRDLLRQQTYALLSTFFFPALAAYLLHVLRGQLSKPSTGLVSDYNISVFLLVAEIRPCRHLIRLVKRRTLHLQRTIVDSDEAYIGPSKSRIAGLTARIDELEQRLVQQQQAEQETLNGHVAKKSHVDELSIEMKKRYESRIDALERAVRRYEKRTTTLAMVTEQRLKTLDGRLESTLSLATVAAQQSRQRSAAGRVMDVLVATTLLPVQLVEFVIMWPIKILEDVYARLMGLLLGPRKSEGKRRDGSKGVEKGRERYSGRKPDVPR